MPQDCYLHNAGKILHLESLQDLNQKMQGVRFFFFKFKNARLIFIFCPVGNESIEEILGEVCYPRTVSLDSPSG